MFSSEQKFTINGDTNEALAEVLKLAFKLSGCKEIKAFYKDINGLVLCSYEEPKTTAYPFKATTGVLIEQINQYIESLSTEEILRMAGPEPDIDGTVNLGWEVFYPLWFGENKIEEYNWFAEIAVRPSWIIYAK